MVDVGSGSDRGSVERLHRRIAELEGERAAQAGIIADLSCRARLLDAVQEAVIATDLEGRVTFWNRAAETLYGWSATETAGRPISELNVPQVSQDEAERIMAALSRGEQWSGEFLARRKDDTTFPALVTDSPITDDEGRLIGIVGVSQDISGIKQTEQALRDASERFRVAILNASLVLAQCDRDLRYRWIYNPHPDFDATAAIGKRDDELEDSEGTRRLVALKQRVLESGSRAREEISFDRGDGLRTYDFMAEPLRDAAGAVVGVTTTALDTTDRKRAQEALRESEARMRSAFANAAIGFAMTTPEGRYVEANAAYSRITGYSLTELQAMSFEQLIHPEDRGANLRLVGQALAGDQTDFVIENRYVRKDGQNVWVRKSLSQVLGAQGEVKWAVALVEDVSDRKRAEAERERLLDEVTVARQEAERRAAELETVIEAVVYPLSIYDGDGRIVRANRAARDIMRYSPEEAALPLAERRKLMEVLTWEGEPLPAEESAGGRALRGETVVSQPVIWRRVGGRPRWLLVSAAPVLDGAGGLAGAVAATVDVTELHTVQAHLGEERLRLAVTLRSIGDGVIATDADGRVTIVNRAAEAITGWREAEAMGRPLAEVFALRGTGGEAVATGGPAAGRAAGLPKRGTVTARDRTERLVAALPAPVTDDGGRVTGAVLVFQDVTLQQRLEDEMLKASKLESLGVLAGGIAHDFNNLLTGILGNVALASMEAPLGSEQAEMLAEAESASLRARGLAQQLLTFARGGEPLRRRLDLPEVLVDAGRFALRGTQSAIEFHLPAGLWPVEADAGQIGQVIQNLVINADQAMPEGGKIRVSAENAWVTEADPLPLRPGPCVKITVADAGMGIPPHLLTRIFDPYFTTKPSGSGIGLAVVYSVVAKHEGHVEVESRPGAGARFHVYLPATGEAATAEPRRGAGAGGRCKGRVLVMDDEGVVTRVARRILERLGYEVATAAGGDEAVRLYGVALADGAPYDAVILDLMVPLGMGGLETLEQLRRIDPRVRAIVSSAHAGHRASVDFVAHGFAAALTKPYDVEQVRQAVASVVGQ